ncbi:MAG: aldehyde dehydrogenase [Chitinophagales bacterium]|nr:aldehyde dehydrogenase [Bacteroidota bacterium]MBP7399743.1 aldehyde dehydrogenase [Chitinophagales bacterium]MBK8486652.1 aldehyde dehydrogenase [Bacteroidota bacterium]MBK8683435.1 aldehyde dehydrogenase [Bacteroidota bacterium]MBP7399820.1 aldehyde dehydrogenase [Chitinophagales bacterium]
MQIIQNYIGGKFVAPQNGKYMPDFNPATDEVIAQIPESNSDDVNDAVQAAKNAFPAWSHLSITKRSKILYRIAELIEEKKDILALAESNDNGKPYLLAYEVEIPRASSNFEFFATAIRHFASEAHINKGQNINYTIKNPIGVVACISPWNLPLYLFSWKVAPALAAGNCVVAKPSEVTPLTAYLLSEICMEAGMPPGVFNIIHGTGPDAGAALVKHPDVKAISFTGSTRAGKEIASIAAPMFKKLSLELGGKNPVLIFADCNYEKMLETTVRSAFQNQGQICLCGSRIYIEQSIYEKFKKDFVARSLQLVIGDPLEPDTKVGAIVSDLHFKKILSYLRLAREEGGKILCGGEVVKLSGRCANGMFIQPTIIEGLDIHCRTNQEEIFGPVVTITPFNTDEEALMLANNSVYGLASVIWTQDLTRAHRMADAIESGIVWINCWLERDLRTPFGGMKQSGVGREGGWEALRFFTEQKNITIQL